MVQYSGRKWYDRNVKHKWNNSCILKMPYLNEDHSKEIRNIIKNSNLNILPIFTPAENLTNKLVNSTLTPPVCTIKNCLSKSPNCLKKSVIYELKCTLCHEIYVGETQRQLHKRLKENNMAIQVGTRDLAIKDHYEHYHQNIPVIPFTARIFNQAKNFID